MGAFFLLLVFPLATWAELMEVKQSNLKDLVERGSVRVSSAALASEAARKRSGFLTRSFLPSLSLHGGRERFVAGSKDAKTQPTYGAELTLNVFNGGKDGIESEIRDLNEEKTLLDQKVTAAEEIEKARVSFWRILYLQERSALLVSTIETNAQNLLAAQKRIKSGVATDSDRFEFEMKEVDLKRELAALAVELKNQKRNLALQLGLEEQELVFPEKLTHDHEFESVVRHSLEDHAFLYKPNEIRASQLSLAAKREGREWWPKLDVFAAYTQFNEREKEFSAARDRTEKAVGVRLAVALSSGFEGLKESAAADLEAKAASQLAAYSKQDVELHVKGEMDELVFLHGQVHDAEANISRAERYYKLTQSEYARGVKNSPDVVGAAEKLFDMRHKKLEIIRDFQLAKAHVLSAIGK